MGESLGNKPSVLLVVLVRRVSDSLALQTQLESLQTQQLFQYLCIL